MILREKTWHADVAAASSSLRLLGRVSVILCCSRAQRDKKINLLLVIHSTSFNLVVAYGYCFFFMCSASTSVLLRAQAYNLRVPVFYY